MGWVTSETDSEPPPNIVLRVCGPNRFQLLAPYGYRAPSGEYFAVPVQSGNPARRGNSTDLASVPSLLWGLFASYGHQLRAAILHDHLCDIADATYRGHGSTRPNRKAGYEERRRADEIFRVALGDSGVPWLRRWLFWCGVAFDRYLDYKRALFAVLAAQVVGVVAAVVIGVAGPVMRLPMAGALYAWLAAVVLLASSALWRRDWPLPLLGSFACIPLGAVLVVEVAAQTLFSIPDYLIWIASGGRAPRPTLHPYVRRFPAR